MHKYVLSQVNDVLTQNYGEVREYVHYNNAMYKKIFLESKYRMENYKFDIIDSDEFEIMKMMLE